VYAHSRGGLIGGEWVRQEGHNYRIELIVSLGSPRVGDAAHGRQVLCNCPTVIRCTNNNDPVSRLPTPLRGYRHYGQHVHIDRHGTLHIGGMRGLAAFADRVMGRADKIREAFTDGTRDHRMQTGFGPRIEALVESAINPYGNA